MQCMPHFVGNLLITFFFINLNQEHTTTTTTKKCHGYNDVIIIGPMQFLKMRPYSIKIKKDLLRIERMILCITDMITKCMPHFVGKIYHLHFISTLIKNIQQHISLSPKMIRDG